MSVPLSDDDLTAIKAQLAEIESPAGGVPVHPADVRALLAEITRLRALVTEPEWEYQCQLIGSTWVPVDSEHRCIGT